MMMRALVARLSKNIVDQYLMYPAALAVSLSHEAGQIEFRCEFTLSRDGTVRHITIKVPADSGETDCQEELLIIMVFEEIENMIDEAIAAERMAVN